MIARILLLCVVWLGISYSVDGLKINSRYSGPPEEVSIADVPSLASTLPRFVRITDAEFGDAICLETTLSKGEEKASPQHELFTPILNAAQSELVTRGTAVSAGLFAKSSNCDQAPSQALLQGVLSSESIDAKVRDKALEGHIQIVDPALVIDPMYAPPSFGSNIFVLTISILAGLAAIVPLFRREKWPKEKDLSAVSLPEAVQELHPILLLGSEDTWVNNCTSNSPTEIVLLKVNCLNSSKRPSLAVLTNKRYILYRTNIQFGLIMLKMVERSLDKIPVVGGIASMLVEPFEDAYEVFVNPERRRFHEAMGYDDAALLTGKVPWHKTCEVELSELPKRAISLIIEKKTFSEGVQFVFTAPSLKGFFKTPSDFTVLQEGSFLVISRFLESVQSTLSSRGLIVTRDERRMEITWAHVI